MCVMYDVDTQHIATIVITVAHPPRMMRLPLPLVVMIDNDVLQHFVMVLQPKELSRFLGITSPRFPQVLRAHLEMLSLVPVA